MINSIHIRGFRGIERGQIDEFRQFNLLVGPNNAGKSALLEALYLATTVGQPAALTDEGQTRDTFGNTFDVMVYAPDLLGACALSRVWVKHGFAARQAGLSDWSDGQIMVNDTAAPPPFKNFNLFTGTKGFASKEAEVIGLVGMEHENEGDGDEEVERERKKKKDEIAAALLDLDNVSLANKRLLFLWHRDLTYFNKGHATWVVAGTLPTAQRTFFFDAEMMRAHLPLGFYQRMFQTIPGWANRVAGWIGEIFDLSDAQVQFIPPSADSRQVQGWLGPRDGLPLPIDSYGDGARAAFKVLTPLVVLADLAQNEQPGLFLWEEPELHMNPQTLGRLLRVVVEIVKDKPIQVFMSTQSLEVVAHITTLLQEQLLFSDDAMAFRLGLRAGELFSARFRYRNLLAWLENGKDPRVWESWDVPWQFRLGGTE